METAGSIEKLLQETTILRWFIKCNDTETVRLRTAPVSISCLYTDSSLVYKNDPAEKNQDRADQIEKACPHSTGARQFRSLGVDEFGAVTWK